jgi:hypothetical protein
MSISITTVSALSATTRSAAIRRPGNCVTLPTPYASAASTPRNVMPSTRSSTSSSNTSRQTSKSRSLNAWW